MRTFVERRRLDASADLVADLVLDWSRDVEWRAAVTSMQVTPPNRAHPGQRVLERLRFAGLAFVTPTTVIEADDRSAAYAGGSGTVAVAGRRTVVPEPDGGCTVVLEVTVGLRGLLAPLTAALAPAYRRRLHTEADALRAACSRPTTAWPPGAPDG